MTDLLQKHPEVLILGTNDQTIKLIKFINKKFNIIPILFAPIRPTPKILFSTKYVFWRQALPNNNYYTMHTILDISKSMPGECRILISCTSHFENIISSERDFFEKEYILCNYKDIKYS